MPHVASLPFRHRDAFHYQPPLFCHFRSLRIAFASFLFRSCASCITPLFRQIRFRLLLIDDTLPFRQAAIDAFDIDFAAISRCHYAIDDVTPLFRCH